MSKKRKTITANHDRDARKILFASDGVSIDATGKLPKCRIVAYTGGLLEWDYKEYPVVVDLDSTRFAMKSIPLLYDHFDFERVGHTTSQNIENYQVILDGVISGVSENATRIAQESKNGFPWQASIGAKYGTIEFIPEGKSVEVNGRKFFGPLEVARDVEIFETSFVVFGADKHTASQVFAKKFKGGSNMTFSDWLAQLGYDEAAISDEVREALQKAFDTINAQDTPTDDGETPVETGVEEIVSELEKVEQIVSETIDELETVDTTDEVAAKKVNAKKTSPRDDLAAYRNRQANETQRIAGIRKICAGRYSELEAKAIKSGMSVTEVENRVLKANAQRERKSVPKTYNGSSGPAVSRVLEASALIATGASPKWLEANGYDQKVLNDAVSAQWRGVGLQRIIATALESQGERIPSGLGGAAFYAHAKSASGRIRAAGGGLNSFSTVSLPGILSNIANKSLLDAYTARESTLMRIATKTSHGDFKGMMEYRLDAAGRMKKVGQDGKIESISLQESRYFNQLETYAALLSLTRQMIIDDDLNAFTSIPREFGQLAFDTREMIGWQMLLNNLTTFFTSANGNLIDDPLSISGIAHAEQLFAEQTNANGMPILSQAKYLLVPPYLYPLARTLYTSMTVNETTETGIAKPVDNPYANMYEPIEVPYMSQKFGGTNTQWIMIADPASIPLVNIAFLNGSEAPVIEESDSSFDTLGYQYRVYMDFGVALFDYRGGVYSDGSGDDSGGGSGDTET